MSNKLIYQTLIIISLFCIYNQKMHATLPEITDENLAELIKSLREGDYVDLHKYMLKYVLHPEEADLNKDRKISPKELRKCIDWLIMPKNGEIRQQLHQEVISKTKAGIELFITTIKDSLTYKQFIELLSRIKIEHFINIDKTKKIVEAAQAGVELPDDL